MLWAQRSSKTDVANDLIWLTISVPDVNPSKLKLDLKIQSSFFGTAKGKSQVTSDIILSKKTSNWKSKYSRKAQRHAATKPSQVRWDRTFDVVPEEHIKKSQVRLRELTLCEARIQRTLLISDAREAGHPAELQAQEDCQQNQQAQARVARQADFQRRVHELRIQEEEEEAMQQARRDNKREQVRKEEAMQQAMRDNEREQIWKEDIIQDMISPDSVDMNTPEREERLPDVIVSGMVPTTH